MLQPSVWSQLARLKNQNCVRRTMMTPQYLGPTKVFVKKAAQDTEFIGSKEKHVEASGLRSVSIAAHHVYMGGVIAVPTDTIYGFAVNANDDKAIGKLYKIKGRDAAKPVAICLSEPKEIQLYGKLQGLPLKLFLNMLPGPYTVILKRTDLVNPKLNPGVENIGIRVPSMKFIQNIAKIMGPLALTSANRSNGENTIHPDEFSDLWPDLAAIFYTTYKPSLQKVGSTVVDLTIPGCYKILRSGLKDKYLETLLNSYKLKKT